MIDLDEALERFQCGALEHGGGLANHGPMAAEALCALGHPALLVGWVDVYAPRVPPRGTGRVLDRTERARALGRRARLDDWIATFEAEVARTGWRAVLREWLPRLAPGLFAGAGHGLLRVAHGLRALGREETGPRVREVAFGLAYWAGAFQRLPGRPGAAGRDGRRPASEWLRTLVPVPPAARRPGLFTDAVRVLDEHAPYVEAVERADPGGASEAEQSAWLSALCREAALAYLAHPGQRIAYAHAVTVPSALRLVLPFAPDDRTRRALLTAGFQAALALHAVSGDAGAKPPELDAQVAALAASVDEIRYRAACSLTEHAIKLAEALLREDRIAPDPLLRLAAADAALGIERRETWSSA